MSFPLDSLELRIRSHAILCTVGFLILLPIGVLVARYSRRLPYPWFFVHVAFQFVIAGPVIFVGWSEGYKISKSLGTGHFKDHHQKIGVALLVLYLVQLAMGTLAHFVKYPRLFGLRRGPPSYFHAVLGLAIIWLASYQVYYGLNIEWDAVTGGAHQVPQSAKHAWLALVILFAVLYALGMALLPSQFRHEREE